MMISIPINAYANGAYAINNGYLYLIGDSSLIKVDLATHTIALTKTLDHNCGSLAISSGKVYTINNDTSNVEVYDLNLNFIKTIEFTNGAADLGGGDGALAIIFMDADFNYDIQKLDTSTDTLGTIIDTNWSAASIRGYGNGLVFVDDGGGNMNVIRLSDFANIKQITGSYTNASEYAGHVDLADGTPTIHDYDESAWTDTPITANENVKAVQKVADGYILGASDGTNFRKIIKLSTGETVLGTTNEDIVKVFQESDGTISAITAGNYVALVSSGPVATDKTITSTLNISVGSTAVDKSLARNLNVNVVKDKTLSSGLGIKTITNQSFTNTLSVKSISSHKIDETLSISVKSDNYIPANLGVKIKNDQSKDVSSSIKVITEQSKIINLDTRVVKDSTKNASLNIGLAKGLDTQIQIAVKKDQIKDETLNIKVISDEIKDNSLSVAVANHLESALSVGMLSSASVPLDVATIQDKSRDLQISVGVETNQVKDTVLETAVKQSIDASLDIDVFHSLETSLGIDVKVYKPTLYFHLSIDTPAYLEKGSTLIAKATVKDDEGYLIDLDNVEIILTEKATRLRRNGYLIDHVQGKYVLGVQTFDVNVGRYFVLIRGTLGQIIQEAYAIVDIQDHE